MKFNLGFLLKMQMLVIYCIVRNYCVITEVVNPKDAKEAAKRLVKSGVCSYIIIYIRVGWYLGILVIPRYWN